MTFIMKNDEPYLKQEKEIMRRMRIYKVERESKSTSIILISIR